MNKYMENCSYFIITFESILNTNGKLYSTCDNDICCDIREFEGLHICNDDDITSEDIFLGNKKRFIDLKVGDCICILEIPVVIKEIDIETIEDYNDFWEQSELEEII